MNNKIIIFAIAFFLFVFSGSYALAIPSFTQDFLSAGPYIAVIGAVLDIIWIIFFAFATVMFIIAGFKFAKGDGAGGKTALFWGIVGTFVGIVAFSIPYTIQSIV